MATIGDASQFHCGRQLAAWLGLVPRQYSSAGKERLGRISKRGDGYIRRFLVHGARADLALVQAQKRATHSMAREPARTPADQCGSGGDGQQDGSCCVGAAQPGRNIPGAGSSNCLNARTNKHYCEGDNDVMAKQGNRDQPNPRHCPSFELVPLTGR
jgi:Transposase IS116/IS110/IS902 family